MTRSSKRLQVLCLCWGMLLALHGIGCRSRATKPAKCSPKLDALLTELAGEEYSFLVPPSLGSTPDKWKKLSADKKAEVIRVLRSCGSPLQPYDLEPIYGIGPTTTGPYSVPPPLVSICVRKGKEHPVDIQVLTREYVRVSTLGAIKNRELATRLLRITRGDAAAVAPETLCPVVFQVSRSPVPKRWKSTGAKVTWRVKATNGAKQTLYILGIESRIWSFSVLNGTPDYPKECPHGISYSGGPFRYGSICNNTLAYGKYSFVSPDEIKPPSSSLYEFRLEAGKTCEWTLQSRPKAFYVLRKSLRSLVPTFDRNSVRSTTKRRTVLPRPDWCVLWRDATEQ